MIAENNTMCVLAQTRVVNDKLDSNSSSRPTFSAVHLFV